MDIDILGEYNFDNFTLLNALMNERDRINTAIHEYTHFVLSNQSVYGTILYCLNKLIIPYDSQNDMNKKRTAEKFFLSNTLKLQEGMAVFVEAIYFLLRDKAEYESFMDDLRKNNPSYYGYVKPLCFILEMIRDEERETILSVTHAVFQVALDSMNAEIYVFDGSLFSTNKSIKKMVSKQDFSKKYLPNKRFVSKIKDCKKATSCQELIKLLWDNVEHKVAELTERLEKIKKFVLGIFSESKYMHLYGNKLAKINLTEKETSDVFLQQLPTAFNEDYIARNMKMVNWAMINQKCKKTAYSTIFLLGNLMDNLSDLLLKMGVNEVEKTRDERELIFFYDLINKEIYSCVLEQKQLEEILRDNENKSVLLTSYKNYDYEQECISNHADIKRFTYIYCDRTYNNAVSIINKWKDKNVYYRYIVYGSMPVLLIKNSNNSMFILPMTPIVADEADRDIRNNHRNMLMVMDVKDEEYDSHVITDAKKKDEIDTIINCLFFMNMYSNEV